jgi:hypothetical protein
MLTMRDSRRLIPRLFPAMEATPSASTAAGTSLSGKRHEGSERKLHCA